MSYQNDRITGIPAPLPADYDRQANFTDYEVLNPGDPPRGVDLDAEFNAVEQALDETQARLRLLQRDDGAVANESIGLDQLKNEARVGVNRPRPWEPFAQYQVNDSVIVDEGAWYVATASHVSSSSFPDDLALGLWQELIDLTPYTTESRNWANFPTDQLVPEGNLVDDYSALHHRTYAETAQAGAETAEAGAVTAQALAETAEAGAVTARTGAETAETGAITAQTNAETAESGAVTARTGAEEAETNAAATLADFRDRFYGALAEDPTTAPSGAAPTTGDLYWNSTTDRLRTYNGTAWQDSTLIGAVLYTALTGAAILPTGTTAERPPGQAGYFRFNQELSTFEGFDGAEWGGVGGATGAGGNPVFYENDQTITGDYTVPGNKNAMSTGPITIQDGVTVTISDGARWVIL